MTDREKVIKGLEWCMNERHDCYREKGCPYENVGDDVGCKYALHRDAIALLKAQEPRMMTLEEVKALQPDTDIWIEVRYLNAPIRIRACTVSGFSPGGTRLFIIGGAHNYPMDTYNNYFRCWTSRPTDAQREEVKWERSLKD